MYDLKVCGDWMICIGVVFKILFGCLFMYLDWYFYYIYVIKSGICMLLGL